jgi:energy-coupling factor transport system ATP-binding protein
MIEFKNIHYKSSPSSGSFDILKNINVKIKKGSFICLIGKNSSGKTTFGKLLKGIIPPTSGEIIVNNKVNTGINNNVGYIFTNPENQIVHPIVEDDIAFGLENLLFDEKDIIDKINIALKEVNMERYLKAQIHKLSKGEQQKVVAAGTIVLENDIIVFDEAASMLDYRTKDEFMEIIFKLNKNAKKTIIFITHNFEDILFADKVLLLDSGKLAFYGTKKEFFENEKLKENFEFDFPDIVNLVNHYKKSGYELDLDYKDIPRIAKKIYSIIKHKLH